MRKILVDEYSEIPENFTGIVEFLSGTKYWYVKGQYHREDGPAVEYINGYKEWWVKGKLHRTDGPAIEYPDGFKTWFLNGSELVPSNIVNLIKNGIYIELLPFLDEETSQVSFSMKWLLADSIIYFPYDFFMRHYFVLQCSETFGEYNKILLQANIEEIKAKNEFKLKG